MSTIPIVASARDVPGAVRFANKNVRSRWYVARKAQALGVGHLVPESWGLTAATWNPDFHPRDRQGRFIEVGDLVRVFWSVKGDGPGRRARVVGSDRDSVVVRDIDGLDESVSPRLIEVVPERKARIGGTTLEGALGGQRPDVAQVRDLKSGDMVYPVPATPAGGRYTMYGSEDEEAVPHQVVSFERDQGDQMVLRMRNLETGQEVVKSWHVNHIYGGSGMGPAFPRVSRPASRSRVLPGSPGPEQITAAAGWDPSLHPRGRDGRFIELGAILDLFEGKGYSFPSARGEAIGVKRDESGDVVLQVRATQGGFFGGKKIAAGDEIDVSPVNAATAKPAKAKLPQAPDVAPTAPDKPTISEPPKMGVGKQKFTLEMVSDPDDEGPKHNKQYSVTIEGNTVTTAWGPIGGTQKEVTQEFSSEAAAADFGLKKVKDKEKKGYALLAKSETPVPKAKPALKPLAPDEAPGPGEPTDDEIDQYLQWSGEAYAALEEAGYDLDAMPDDSVEEYLSEAYQADPSADAGQVAMDMADEFGLEPKDVPDDGVQGPVAPLSVDPSTGEPINYGQVVVGIQKVMETGRSPSEAMQFIQESSLEVNKAANGVNAWEIEEGVSVDPATAAELAAVLDAVDSEGADLMDVIEVASNLIPDAADWKASAPGEDVNMDDAFEAYAGWSDEVLTQLQSLGIDIEAGDFPDDAIEDYLTGIYGDDPSMSAADAADAVADQFELHPSDAAVEDMSPTHQTPLGQAEFGPPKTLGDPQFDDVRMGWQAQITRDGEPVSDPAEIATAADALGINVDEYSPGEQLLVSLPDDDLRFLATEGALDRVDDQGIYTLEVDPGEAIQVLQEAGLADSDPGEIDIAQEGYADFSAWTDEALNSTDAKVPDNMLGEVLDELEAIYLKNEGMSPADAIAQVQASRPELFTPGAESPSIDDIGKGGKAGPATPDDAPSNNALDGYAADLLNEAMAYAVDNEDEQDEELNAQIGMLESAIAGGDAAEVASRARHLRGMLLISYADDEDLPEAPPDLDALADSYGVATDVGPTGGPEFNALDYDPVAGTTLQDVPNLEDWRSPAWKDSPNQATALREAVGTYVSSDDPELEQEFGPEIAQAYADLEVLSESLGYDELGGVEDYLDDVDRLDSLNWAISEQLDSILAGQPLEDQDANALKILSDTLVETSSDTLRDLGMAIREYIDAGVGDMEASKAKSAQEKADDLDTRLKAVVPGPASQKVWSAAIDGFQAEGDRLAFVESVTEQLEAADSSPLPPDVAAMLKDWIVRARTDNPNGPMDEEEYVGGVAQEAIDLWLSRHGNPSKWYKVTDQKSALQLAKPDSFGTGVAVFPVDDPREGFFGSYEVWAVKPGGVKSGRVMVAPTKELADAYAAESNRLTDLLNGVDPSIASASDEELFARAALIDDGLPHFTDGSEGIDPIVSRGIYAELGRRGYPAADIKERVESIKSGAHPADVAAADDDGDIPEGTSIAQSGTKYKATNANGISSFFDDPGEAAKWLRGEPAVFSESALTTTPGEGVDKPGGGDKSKGALLRAMAKSAVNKGLMTQEEADFEIGDILNDPDPASAQKQLASLMTRLKLGGKQRKRYREILDAYHGKQAAQGPAEIPDKMSKADVEQALAEPTPAPEPEVPAGPNGLLDYYLPDGGVTAVKTGGTPEGRNETYDVFDSKGRKIGTVRASHGYKDTMKPGSKIAISRKDVTRWSFQVDPSLEHRPDGKPLPHKDSQRLRSTAGLYADSRAKAMAELLDTIEVGGFPYDETGKKKPGAPPSKSKVTYKGPPKAKSVDIKGLSEKEARLFAERAEDGQAKELLGRVRAALGGKGFPVGSPQRTKLVMSTGPLEQRAGMDETRVRFPKIGSQMKLPTGFYDDAGNSDVSLARDLAAGNNPGSSLDYAMRRFLDGGFSGIRPQTRVALIREFMAGLKEKASRPPGDFYGEPVAEGVPYTKLDLVSTRLEDVQEQLKEAGDGPVVLKVPSGSEVGIPRGEAAALARLLFAFRDDEYRARQWLEENAGLIGMTASAAHEALRSRVRPDSPPEPIEAAGDPKKARKKALKGRVHGVDC